MILEGTVVNGSVIINVGTRFPEGSQVRLELLDTVPSDREAELQLLRESIASLKAGEVGRPLREVMDELSQKHGLPALPPV